MIYTWDLNPIALSIMGLEVRWYGLAYVFGFFIAGHIGWYLWQKFKDKDPFWKKNKIKMTKADFENFVFSTFIVGVISARLGVFLFYYPETLISDPLEVLRVWHGGMSIHGGLLGATLWGVWQCRRQNWPVLRTADIFMLPLAIGLFFGRIANFINGELYGRVTDQTWGVIFPHVDMLLRHPSQLYEASKNLLLALILWFLIRKGAFKKPGLLTVVMIAGYGILRFLIEFVREPDTYLGPLTTGQALCTLMMAIAASIAYQQKFWKS